MNSLQCETCGNAIAADAPSGLCPICLLRTAIEHGSSRALAPFLPKLRYFGDYELLEEIARGGMGVVYRAKQVSLDRIVALKMMRPGLLSTAPEIRRFLSEARTAASLQHPNIVAIHEAGEFDGLHYFSMDFVAGPNLATVVRGGPLPQMEAARYLRILAETVQYAHTRGVLHRDLKPSNILVDAEGRPRITDFGLALRLDGDATLTGSGEVMGTPAYMPPEQASGQTAGMTAASDVYSLGAILYELLTGEPPFRAGSRLEIVRLVLETEPQRPRLLNPALDSRIEAICLQCLAKDPAMRFQSAAELASDLKRFLDGELVHSRVPRKAPRRFILYSLLAAAGLLAILMAWLFSRNASPPKPALITRTEIARPAKPPGNVAEAHAAKPPFIHTNNRDRKAAPPVVSAEPVPVAASISPAAGSGYNQVFSLLYPAAPGLDGTAEFEVEFRDATAAGARHCNILIEPSTGRVQLQFDPLRGPALRVAGNIGTLDRIENSICAIDLSGVTIARRENATELLLPMTFKPSFDGVKQIASWVWKKQGSPKSETTLAGQWTVGPRQ